MRRRPSPPHDHVRLDGLPGAFQVGARVLHVKADGVHLVARGLGQAIPPVEQGSVALPMMPKADLDMTQVSRGRCVTRSGGSLG